MVLFVLGFLVFIVLFTLAAVQGTRIAGRVMGERINALHQAAELILETERIPDEWLEPLPSDTDRVRRWEQRQQRRAVRRIRKVRTYMQRTPCISDVESREHVMMELDRIRDQWRGCDSGLLVSPAPNSSISNSWPPPAPLR